MQSGLVFFEMYIYDRYIHMKIYLGFFMGPQSHIDMSTGKKIYIFNLVRIRIGGRNFTPANTGLDKGNQFPELGSVFKASFLKSCLWYYAKLAVELSEKHPEDMGFQHMGNFISTMVSYGFCSGFSHIVFDSTSGTSLNV